MFRDLHRSISGYPFHNSFRTSWNISGPPQFDFRIASNTITLNISSSHISVNHIKGYCMKPFMLNADDSIRTRNIKKKSEQIVVTLFPLTAKRQFGKFTTLQHAALIKFRALQNIRYFHRVSAILMINIFLTSIKKYKNTTNNTEVT